MTANGSGEISFGTASVPWMTIGDITLESARRYGSAVAVAFSSGDTLTYVDVERRSARVAHGLLTLGVRKGDRVASLLPNGVEQLLLWLGASRMGAIAVPVNVSLKQDDLAHALKETLPRIFAVGGAHLSTYEAARDAVGGDGRPEVEIVVDDGGRSGDDVPPGYLRFGVLEGDDKTTDASLPAIDPRDPCCILFTGGTTGSPKAVIRTHFSYVCAAVRYAELFRPTPGDRHLSCTHLFHCGGQELGFLGPLMSGVPTLIPEWFSASRYWDTARTWGATIVEVMPSVISILLRAQPRADDAEHSVRVGLGAGKDRLEFERRFGFKVLDVFGMTETGTLITSNHVDDFREGSVGRPRDWCELSIVGERDELLPAGQVGEVCIRPTLPFSMSSGYFGQPLATTERWRNLWIHTGDIGYLDEDGWLFVVGRQAHWIRRRGENVSVEEVESALNAHPAIVESAVVGVASDLGDEEIRAYVVLDDVAVPPTMASLRSWCESRLAYFKVPAQVFVIDRLPRSAAKGEIERHKLPHWDSAVSLGERA